MKNKIKVAWICHFTNAHIQEIIKPRRSFAEMATWVTSFIKVLQNKEDMDLHIISPHRWITKYKTFIENGITYHFFNPGIPFYGRHWPSFFRFDRMTNYFFNKRKVSRIVNKIKPDIIHLMGAENAYYSSTLLQFKGKYPSLVTVQGFISHSNGNSKDALYRKTVEKKILETFKHFGYRTETMGESIKSFNKQAILHWHRFPMFVREPLNIAFDQREYDCVFFARVSKDKGIEDLLEAIALLKKMKNDIKLLVIGSSGKSYADFLKNKCVELNIANNITWAGFLPTQEDVYIAASHAKICVLPTYHDIISGTIIESLFLKIPVVAYNVGSIHELNKDKQHVILVDKFDINGLAKNVSTLLHNDKLLNEMAENGYKIIRQWFDNSKVYPVLMNVYQKIIQDFQNNRSIHN